MQKRLFCCLHGQGRSQDCFAAFMATVTVKIVLLSSWSRSLSRVSAGVSGNSSRLASLSPGGTEERDYPALSAVAVVVSVTGSLRKGVIQFKFKFT